jgi:hypothetical protein
MKRIRHVFSFHKYFSFSTRCPVSKWIYNNGLTAFCGLVLEINLSISSVIILVLSCVKIDSFLYIFCVCLFSRYMDAVLCSVSSLSSASYVSINQVHIDQAFAPMYAKRCGQASHQHYVKWLGPATEKLKWGKGSR